MSPEYRVYIPPDVTEEFEGTVSDIGGKIIEKRANMKDTIEATRKEWERQTAEAGILVAQFTQQEHDPHVLQGINKGVVKLVGDILQVTPWEIRDDLDWNAVKQTLGDVFQSYIPPDIPDNIVSNPMGEMNTPRFARRPHSQKSLLPRQVIVLMQRYGLADGVQRPLTDVGKMHGVSGNAIRGILDRSLRVLAVTPQLQDAILKHPRQRQR